MPIINNEIERVVIQNTLGEYEIDKENHSEDNTDFDVHMNLFNLIGDAPDEDWMADIKLPEFLSEIVTQASMEAAQEFRRRDFVEIYRESKEKKHIDAGDADKELVNRTLNQPHDLT